MAPVIANAKDHAQTIRQEQQMRAAERRRGR
jgi:hypothetical protein